MGAKGQPRTGGRKLGTPNKVNQALADVKSILRESLDEAHPDGAKAFFTQLAKDYPQTYAQIVSKLVPNALQVEMANDVRVILDFSGGNRGGKAAEQE